MISTTFRPPQYFVRGKLSGWLLACVVAWCAGQGNAWSSPTELIRESVDDGKRTVMTGHVRAEIAQAKRLGAVNGDTRFNHLKLQLRRSDAQEAALTRYVDELHDPGSTNYR